MADSKPSLAPWMLGGTAAVALVVLAWAWLGFEPPQAATPATRPSATASTPASVSAASPSPPRAAPDPSSAPVELVEFSAGGWEGVDLEALRDEMPDNLYWTEGAPTNDERVKRERDERARYWDQQFGRVQANIATDDEIEAFYAHKQRLSSDYVEFTTAVLDRHGDDLNERDRRLLELSRNLHLARLSEVPRKLEEAFERADAHREARRAWLENEAEFRGEAAAGTAEDEVGM